MAGAQHSGRGDDRYEQPEVAQGQVRPQRHVRSRTGVRACVSLTRDTALGNTPRNRAEVAAAAPFSKGAEATAASALGSLLPLGGFRSSATSRSSWHTSTRALAMERSMRIVAESLLPALISSAAAFS